MAVSVADEECGSGMVCSPKPGPAGLLVSWNARERGADHGIYVFRPEVPMCAETDVISFSRTAANPARTTYRTDIFIRRSEFRKRGDRLEVPLSDAGFNECGNLSDSPTSAYKSFLHEVGHALGLGHPPPSTRDSVMNYVFDEPDCAPHPLDVMAIWG